VGKENQLNFNNMIRDHEKALGLMVHPGSPPPQPAESQILGELTRRYRAMEKMKPIDNEDPEVISRVKHVLLKKEKLMSFYARTGLGKAQIMTMSGVEIARFVETATANSLNEPAPILTVWEASPLPKKFTFAAIDTYENS
jgi:hypothetical protein